MEKIEEIRKKNYKLLQENTKAEIKIDILKYIEQENKKMLTYDEIKRIINNA